MIFAFDTETHRIRPGLLAPPIVCGQWAMEATVEVNAPARFREVFEAAARLATRPVFVGHNVAYDMAVICAKWPDLIPTVFDLYEQDRVTDTQIREKLVRIGLGTDFRYRKNSLPDLAARYKIETSYHLGDDGKKEEYWRINYDKLDGIPITDWPDDAIRYAKEDARVTTAVYHAQKDRHDRRFFEDEFRQTRAAFFLHLMSCRGIMTDLAQVTRFSEAIEEEAVAIRARLTAAGLVRSVGSKDTKAAARYMQAACAAAGLPVELTDKGAIKLSKDACEATGDPVLRDYARYTSLKGLRARAHRIGMAARAGLPIQTRFTPLLETGRTSSSKGADIRPGQPVMVYGDQIQNLNREPGLRECYVPRSGYLFASVDWSSAELHTLAQVTIWLGLSDCRMAAILNSGVDLHMKFGADIMGLPSYGWAQEALTGVYGPEDKKRAKEARQLAKAANFGLPGGLGVTTFRKWAATVYGVILSEEKARALKSDWLSYFPEMREYFNHINRLIESGDPLKHFKSNRFRGDIRYTSACNSYFQGLASDMAKSAGFELAKACYVPGADPVLGTSRPVNFIHDEFLVEVPKDLAHEATMAIVRIMENAGKDWCPDVPVRAEPALMRRWRKNAEQVYDESGRLIPWEDREQ